MGLTLISIIYSPAAGKSQVKSIFFIPWAHTVVPWVYKPQKKKCLKFISLLPEEKPFLCFIACWYPCRMLPHDGAQDILVCLFVCLWQIFFHIHCLNTGKQHTDTYIHVFRECSLALFFFCVSLFVCQHIVSVGWGCEVVSCKAWPFLPPFAHTHTRAQTLKYTNTHKVSACILPVLSQWYWGAVSL